MSDHTIANIPQIDANQLKEMLDNGDTLLVDVRETDEYAAAHIQGAKLMPLSTFHVHIDELNAEDRAIVFQCKAGGRSQQAAEAVKANGLKNDVFNLAGGIEGWAEAGFSVKKL